MNTIKQYRLVIVFITIAVTGAAAFHWLKAEHVARIPIQTARQFIDYLQADDFESALDLTMKNSYVGNSPEALAGNTKQQLCILTRLVGTFPFQSNGNRVRRWLANTEIEMPEIHIEFAGQCLFRITLRHIGDDWKIYNFASHAG